MSVHPFPLTSRQRSAMAEYQRKFVAEDRAQHMNKPGFDEIERAMDEHGHLGRIVATGGAVTEVRPEPAAEFRRDEYRAGLDCADDEDEREDRLQRRCLGD